MKTPERGQLTFFWCPYCRFEQGCFNILAFNNFNAFIDKFDNAFACERPEMPRFSKFQKKLLKKHLQ